MSAFIKVVLCMSSDTRILFSSLCRVPDIFTLYYDRMVAKRKERKEEQMGQSE